MAAQVTLTEAVSSKPTSAKTLSVPLEMKDRSGGLVFETLLSAIRPVDRCCHRSELSRLNLTCLPHTSTSLPVKRWGPCRPAKWSRLISSASRSDQAYLANC
jgi:hypothetical protein